MDTQSKLATSLIALPLLAFCSLDAGTETPPRSIIIQTGHSVQQLGTLLEKSGTIRSALAFRLLARITGYDTRLKAGEYLFEPGTNLLSILKKMDKGEVILHPITIPEGWTSSAIAKHLETSTLLTGTLPETLPEGRFLPDTYLVERGETRANLLRRMTQAQDKTLKQLWKNRQQQLPLQNPDQARILASIIETEAGNISEMKRIAAVFINRMQNNMRLESDPTTIYGITRKPSMKRGLRLSELKQYTPYNTYQIKGLPPAPICNPGADALDAALNPGKSTEFFFVANGKGGHLFAQNYAQHQLNVAQWRKIQ